MMWQVAEGTGLDGTGTGSRALGSLGIQMPQHCLFP